MQVKTLASILAISTALAFAGPAAAQVTINGTAISADDLPKVQARCAEIAASTSTESAAAGNTDTSTQETETAAAAQTPEPVPQANEAANATSAFDLDTLTAELCAGVPAAN